MEAGPETQQAMIEWRVPQTIRDLQGFLGLAGYYRHFVPNYEDMATPLSQLLKIGLFEWSEAATMTFGRLKNAMITLTMLALSDYIKSFVVKTDASSTSLGVVLSQNRRPHPIVYFSHTLST